MFVSYWNIKAATLTAILLGNFTLSFAQDENTIREMVSRLDLEQYKSVIKGLAQFGDRRQGTARNRRAVDWIEEQLQAIGCANTQRLHYIYDPEPRPPRDRTQTSEQTDLTTSTGGKVGRNGSGPGGAAIFGYRAPTGVNRDLMAQPDERIRD